MDLFKGLFSKRQKKQLGLPSGLQWSLTQGLWTPYNDRDSTYIDKAYKAVPIIQSIVSKIIDKASDAPPQVMRVTNDKLAKSYFLRMKHARTPNQIFKARAIRKKAFEQIEDHEFLEVMESPNPMQTGKELREASMGYLLLTGNAIEYAASPLSGQRMGQPRQLWSIPSPCVKPIIGSRLNPISGYQISYMDQQPIDPSKILHVKYYNPVSVEQDIIAAYWGLSPLRSSMNLLSQKRSADITQGTLFANAGPAGLISGNRQDNVEFTEEQGGDINEHFRQNHMGVHNAGNILVTPADVKWVNIGLGPVDLDMLNFNQDLERQISNIYNWPVNMLQPGGVVSNSEVSQKQIITNCVIPLLRRFDDGRTKKIREWYKDPDLVYVSDLGYYPELEIDKEAMSKWMRQAGVFTQAEIREALDYESEYDPSEVLVPSNLIQLSDLMGQDLPIDENNQDF